MGFSVILNPIFRWLNHERPLEEIPLSNFERIKQEIKPCDVILIEGRTRISEVIKLITQSPWSHSALYIGKLNEIQEPRIRQMISEHYRGPSDEPLLLESKLGVGTIIRPLSIYNQEHIRICRPRGLHDEDANDVIRYALSRIGYDYDVRQILDLARFLFPWRILPRRFRSTLFKVNPGGVTKTVCSTLIAESFGFVNFPILPVITQDKDNNLAFYQLNPKLIVPSQFDYSPYFDVIKCPYVEYGTESGYHQLPWQGAVNLKSKKGAYRPPSQSLH